MVRITIDDEMKQRLLKSDGVVELVDAAGALVCRVFPEAIRGAGGGRFVPPLPTEEELERRAASDSPGISTDELLRRLHEKP